MIVYCSTVQRAAPVPEGGELLKVDWQTKAVLARTPIAPLDPVVDDPNPRGNSRGGRGIVVRGDRVTVASYHSLHRFDLDLNPIGTHSNPLFAGLHEIFADPQGIWVTATAIDLALLVDDEARALEAWWGREDPVIQARFNVRPKAVDKDADNRLRFLTTTANEPGHLHLNAVTVHGSRPFVVLNHVGAIVKLNPTEIVVADPTLKGCHNVLVTDDSILVNDTLNRAVRVYDMSGSLRSTIDLTKYELVQRILKRHSRVGLSAALVQAVRDLRILNPLRRKFAGRSIARPVFVRGLALASPTTILVGISPAALLEIDWRTGKLVSALEISRDIRCAIHGIALA